MRILRVFNIENWIVSECSNWCEGFRGRGGRMCSVVGRMRVKEVGWFRWIDGGWWML